MVGQLVLGFLADRLGRRRLLLVSGGLTITGALGSACAFDFGADHVGIWALLITWRFVMGFGIGGEYPLSAAHTAEHSRAETSGRRLAWVFVLFGVGPLLASVVVYICQVAGASPEFTWRCAFGFGGALSVLSLTLRYSLVQNSPSFERVRRERERRTQREPMLDSEGGGGRDISFGSTGVAADLDTAGVAGGLACSGSLFEGLRETLSVARRYRRPLLGTMLCWMLYDIVDYGLGMYSDKMLQKLKVGTGDASTTLAVMITQMISLPGCVASVWLVQHAGRRRTQLLGLGGMLLTYVTLAIILSLPSLKDAADKQPILMVSLYALQLTFDYMGPGATTYIIPAELFPTSARATCHGLSAASGKADVQSDVIVEIGCSYGGCSQLLLASTSNDKGYGGKGRTSSHEGSVVQAEAACDGGLASAAVAISEPRRAAAAVQGRYVGIDNSFECVSRCRALMPSARFEKLDALSDGAGLASLLAAERPSLVVIDVGGNRALADITELIERVVRELAKLDGQAKRAWTTPSAATADQATEEPGDSKGSAAATSAAAPWPSPSAQPPLILVKSEALAAELTAHAKLAACGPDAIRCPDGWWSDIRAQCVAQTAQDKAAGIDRHRLRPPTWYPQRLGPDGVNHICRFHNYDAKRGCKRGEACPLDHEHCHYCLVAGHAAHACEAFRATFQATGQALWP